MITGISSPDPFFSRPKGIWISFGLIFISLCYYRRNFINDCYDYYVYTVIAKRCLRYFVRFNFFSPRKIKCSYKKKKKNHITIYFVYLPVAFHVAVAFHVPVAYCSHKFYYVPIFPKIFSRFRRLRSGLPKNNNSTSAVEKLLKNHYYHTGVIIVRITYIFIFFI